MGPQKQKNQQPENRKNVVVVSSKRLENYDGAEETEIAAQITVPAEGGWGWVVVFASFWSIFIMDGCVFSYGSMFRDMAADLGVSDSIVAIVNSLTTALYFLGAPLASAIINRFGFRACIMLGSVICSVAMLISHFSTTVFALCIFYGIFVGLGSCFINVSAALVVGFYFERLRSVALAMATSGSSFGVMLMYPLTSYIVQLAGWRVVILFHSGLFGFVYFLGMAYRPLLSLSVVKTTDDATRTVTYLPSLAAVKTTSRTNTERLTTTATERFFGAISNVHFPTAAEVVVEGPTDTNQAGTSTGVTSKLILAANNPRSRLSKRQLNQVKSIISKAAMHNKTNNLEVNIETSKINKDKKSGCWGRLCYWEEHIPESRPMYRDDAFYGGRVDKLSVYQKSTMEVAKEARTGLEYQLAVSRAVTTVDLKEKRGVFTTAAKRIIVTMMDPSLLALYSFRLLCASCFLMYIGYLVPYIYIQDRSRTIGIDEKHCDLFVSIIGFANIVGKLTIGALGCKLDAFKLYYVTMIVAGTSTILSNVSFDVYYQYVYCVVFGFFISSIASLRSMVIVNFYGLEKLTNATGIMLTFQGLGSLICTPLASAIKNSLGYDYSFYISGMSLVISGCVIIPVSCMFNKGRVEEISIQPPPPLQT